MKKLLLVLIICLCARTSEGAWAIDRAWAESHTTSSGTTHTFTYAGAVASGALLVCFAAGDPNTLVVSSVIDSTNSVNWTQFTGSPQDTGSSQTWDLSAWYFLNSAAGTPTVTVTWGASASIRTMFCGSYTGIATSSAFDVGKGSTQNDPGTGTNAVTTGATSATANANELAIAGLISQESVGVTTGTNIAWSQQINTTTGGNFKIQVEHVNIAASATVTATWTIDNAGGDTHAIVGTFKEPAAAGNHDPTGLLGVIR